MRAWWRRRRDNPFAPLAVTPLPTHVPNSLFNEDCMREIYTSWLDDEDGEDEDKGRQPDMPMTAGPVQNALFKSRTVLVFGEIDMRLAERVTAQIAAFSNE